QASASPRLALRSEMICRRGPTICTNELGVAHRLRPGGPVPPGFPLLRERAEERVAEPTFRSSSRKRGSISHIAAGDGRGRGQGRGRPAASGRDRASHRVAARALHERIARTNWDYGDNNSAL